MTEKTPAGWEIGHPFSLTENGELVINDMSSVPDMDNSTYNTRYEELRVPPSTGGKEFRYFSLESAGQYGRESISPQGVPPRRAIGEEYLLLQYDIDGDIVYKYDLEEYVLHGIVSTIRSAQKA